MSAVTTDVIEGTVQRGQQDAVIVGLGEGQRLFDPAQLGIAIQHVFDRCPVFCRHFLCHVRDHPVLWIQAVAAIRVQLVQDQREQAGLATTVGPGNADFLTRIDLETGMLKQQAVAAA